MRITVDQEKCCGAGLCAQSVPEIFAQREEDRIVVLLNPEPDAYFHEAVRDAADACPRSAIEVNETS
ncbi:ferredoxin [Nonomuraea sp. NPDC049421]|uniref:ferredoxin n=1 Tax=Nonomuraea sp. NPDC049421 TaxID=3155275 RepID=UPI0034392A75